MMKFLGFDIFAYFFKKKLKLQSVKNFESKHKKANYFGKQLKELLFRSKSKPFEQSNVSENTEEPLIDQENLKATFSQTNVSHTSNAKSRIFFPQQRKTPVSQKA